MNVDTTFSVYTTSSDTGYQLYIITVITTPVNMTCTHRCYDALVDKTIYVQANLSSNYS
jgi:hypothetical protein